jgi:hypothetical protein
LGECDCREEKKEGEASTHIDLLDESQIPSLHPRPFQNVGWLMRALPAVALATIIALRAWRRAH